MLQALSTFDPSSPVKFSTYATVCVKNAIINLLVKEKRNTDNYDTSSELDREADGKTSAEEVMVLNDKIVEIIQSCGQMTDREEDILFNRLLSESPETHRALARKWEAGVSSIVRDEKRLKSKIKENFEHGKGE